MRLLRGWREKEHALEQFDVGNKTTYREFECIAVGEEGACDRQRYQQRTDLGYHYLSFPDSIEKDANT